MPDLAKCFSHWLATDQIYSQFEVTAMKEQLQCILQTHAQPPPPHTQTQQSSGKDSIPNKIEIYNLRVKSSADTNQWATLASVELCQLMPAEDLTVSVPGNVITFGPKKVFCNTRYQLLFQNLNKVILIPIFKHPNPNLPPCANGLKVLKRQLHLY